MLTRQPDESTEAYHARLALRAPTIDCINDVVSLHFQNREDARAFFHTITTAFRRARE